MREFRKEILAINDEIEAFCIVPEKTEHTTAQADKSSLGLWADIPDQTHSLNVATVTRHSHFYRDTDALITCIKEIPIGVVTADCVPILLHAPDVGFAAAVHAGWRGTLGGIVDRVMDELESHGADPERMKVIFGPCISRDVYEVDRELGDRFVDAGFGESVEWPQEGEGKPHIDLRGVNIERLRRRGVKTENISQAGGCTYGNPLYHSYRRDGEMAGRQLTAIVLR